MSVVKGGCTRYYEVDGGGRIPAEAHRVTQHQLRLRSLETQVLAEFPAVANQSVDVVRQAQQLAARIFQLQLQKVAAALDPVRALHHVNHAHQLKLPARKRDVKNMQTIMQFLYMIIFAIQLYWKLHNISFQHRHRNVGMCNSHIAGYEMSNMAN